jgi:hypothetical protein
MSSDRLQRALAAFDAENARDPNLIAVGGVERPRELVDTERLAQWVEKLAPDASEPLRLAAHCQHLRRWEIPRSSYAEGRVGYLEWRKALARFHADEAAKILRTLGYDDATLDAVRRIQMKQDLRGNPDAQTMEDALCLSFLEHEIGEFAPKHSEPKLVDILQKTWKKMSESGRARALELELAPAVQRLVARALGA